MLPTTIRHKILLTTVLCALVILAGFSTVFLIARQQQELVQNHLELPLVAQNWFRLSNKLHQTLRLRLETATDEKGNTDAWKKVWIKEIEPLLNILEDLYKKERLWENERQVEARTFYDIRLMMMQSGLSAFAATSSSTHPASEPFACSPNPLCRLASRL